MISIYLAIGFGVWLGLFASRLKKHKFKYIMYHVTPTSFVKGFIGAVIFWPICIFLIRE